MVTSKAVIGLCLVLALGVSGCSRQQSDWEKTRASNTTDSYEQFLKKYPSGEFTAQAQARVKELYEEHDWQKARDTDTLEGYQAFLKQYPEGKWAEEARIRVENFSLAQAPSSATPGAPDAANATANASPGAPSSTSTTASNAGDTVADAVAAASPHPAPKAPAGAAHPPAKSAKAAATAASATSGKKSSGSYGIQLGAFKSSAEAAKKRWLHLTKLYPKPFAGLSPTVAPKKGASGTVYRLQVVGLTEKHARAICASMKAKSQACVVVRPGR